MKCPKCLEDKLKTYAFAKDKKWCEDCIFVYQTDEYDNARTKWMQQNSDQEIDKLLKRYCKHNHMTRKDGWLISEPGYDSSKITPMSPYELYDYTRLIEQWNVTEQYSCDNNILNIISHCRCGSKCSPETRTLIEKPTLSFKCTNCDQACDNPNSILQCECENVRDDINAIKYHNKIDTDKIVQLNIISNKFIGKHIYDCIYTCDEYDRRDLLVLPGHERIIFGRGITHSDIEKYNPDLLKYYDQEDYFLSYVYICFNCKKNQIFRADHIAFEIGDVFDCPHCNHPFTYFKVSKKGPFKVPSQYQFILDNMESYTGR